MPLRDTMCDNDDCEFDDDLGRWVHAEAHDAADCDYQGCSHQGCGADEYVPLTPAQFRKKIRNAPPTSFLANVRLGGAVL